MDGYLTAEDAWDTLISRRRGYYQRYAALYSGHHGELSRTADRDSFWRRHGKAKIHVPVAADIAATSADLLFGEEPRYVISGTERANDKKMARLREILDRNDLHSKLCEAAESGAVLGGVCLKLNWSEEELDVPVISLVQSDDAVVEYRLGQVSAIHFFTPLRSDLQAQGVTRIYERYTPGDFRMALYEGTPSQLGEEKGEGMLRELGFEPVCRAPVDELLAIYVPNMRPNRFYRGTQMGRSDMEGLRDLMDALDECYSSWMRDVRLSKSRLIVPAEYLRRKNLFRDGAVTYEFDEDVETLVALDMDPDRAGTGITPSQFKIRTDEHARTCDQLLRNIISIAGYAPQTFGLDIRGQAESGTALHMREKKSYVTRSKKENYWKGPLERFLTAMIHLDEALYGKGLFEREDRVTALFSDSIAQDLTTIAGAVRMMREARAASLETCVSLLHPDWDARMVEGEVERIQREEGEAPGQPDKIQKEETT